MADVTAAPTARCPWCSEPLPAEPRSTCPSCGATLTGGDAEPQLPGVTTLDTDAILRARSAAGSRPRGRLMSLITGEPEDGGEVPGSPESLAPPSEAVRREMLRIALAAEVADQQAELDARVADELEERAAAGEPIDEDVLAPPSDDGVPSGIDAPPPEAPADADEASAPAGDRA